MVQKIDDYYSHISSVEETNASNTSWVSASLVKKKIKIKAKALDETELKGNEASQQIPVVENITEEEKRPETLNDALEQNKKPKLTVVSRADIPQKKQEKKGENESPSPAHTQKIILPEISLLQVGETIPSTEDIVDVLVEKHTPKFKPGFSKVTPKPLHNPSISRDDDKGWKKWKVFSPERSGKYKNKFDLEDTWFTRSNKLKTRKKEEKKIEEITQNLTTHTGETVIIWEFLSLKEFSEKIGVPLPKLIAEFMKNGMMMTINSQIDFDTASLIAESFEVTLERDASGWVGIDDLASGNIKEFLAEDDESKLIQRAPVISIMGHVDHGKTSLLDYIRKAKVAAGEAGGITQSIGAYQVEYQERKITFLDTPGHEAFTIMRSRGAKSTDIAILVVAADEGVKPQTVESISHAREAGIPIIVAINKMDKEGANPDHVKAQLAELGLSPEEWGGDTPMVPVSAHTGFGIDDLLEIILLVSDMLELKANPQRNGIATIIESHLDMQLGPVATVLVNTGTIEKWAAIVCGASYGKVKVLKDYLGKGVKYALPGMPVLVVWLDQVAEGWDILQVVSWIDVARQKSVEYQDFMTNKKKLKTSQLDILMTRIKSGNLKHLKIVLKSDTNGSLEAIKNALLKLSTEETAVSIIHSGVGNITEGDVLMCGGSSAILVWFWVSVGVNAKGALEKSWVEFIQSKIIYHITERIEKIVTGMLDPKEVEVQLCEAKVGGIFYSSSKFMVLGLIIKQEESVIQSKALVRVIRGERVVAKGVIESLKQGVEEVHRLEGPIECGIKLKWTSNVEMWDTLEVYKIVIEK